MHDDQFEIDARRFEEIRQGLSQHPLRQPHMHFLWRDLGETPSENELKQRADYALDVAALRAYPFPNREMALKTISARSEREALRRGIIHER